MEVQGCSEYVGGSVYDESWYAGGSSWRMGDVLLLTTSTSNMKYDRCVTMKTVPHPVGRRWSHICWWVYWRVSVRSWKLCFMCVTLPLFFIYWDHVHRRRAAAARDIFLCALSLLCKSVTQNPQNDTNTQQRNPEIMDTLTACSARLQRGKHEIKLLTRRLGRWKYSLYCRIKHTHGSFRL